MNGRCSRDNDIGKFACINTQGRSVIDFVLCKTKKINNVCNIEISDPNILSDHCSVYFSLKSRHIQNDNENIDNEGIKILYMYRWDASNKDMYINSLSSNEVLNQFENLCHNIGHSENAVYINEILSTFCEILENVCTPCLKRTSVF